MSETTPEDETVNEITRATARRQDAVLGPATGRPFLMLKNQARQRTSPAQAAALMKAAADRETSVRLYKGKYSEAEKRAMGAKGHAFRNDDGSYSYPIGNTGDLHDAILAVGRGGASHDAIRRYIRRRAKELGAEGAIPESWSSEGDIKKAMDIGEVHDDLAELHDATEVTPGDTNDEAAGTVEPTHPGDPNDPGSPAWEAVDAATARGAMAFLNKLNRILCKLKEREGAEIAAGEPAEEHVMDLAEAEAALDYVTGVVAKFANDEQAEADAAAHEIEQTAEAMGIRKAQEGTPVTEPTPAPAPAPAPEPLTKAGPLDADAMKKIMKKIIDGMDDGAVAAAFADMAQHAATGAASPDDDDSAPADENPGGPGGAAPAPAPAPMDKAAGPTDVMSPNEVNRSTVPGPDTTPTAVDDDSKLQKAQDAQEQPVDIMKALNTLGDRLLETFEGRLRAEIDQVVGPMQETIKKMQERVAPGGPLLNGVNTPPPAVEGHTMTRGQAQATATANDSMVEMRKQLDKITDPEARAAAQNALAVALMRETQGLVGPAPTFGSRLAPRPAAQ